MKEKFLPIGTIVLLEGATKRMMITGYCSAVPEDPNRVYDYVGCLFPEGNLAGEDVALFDHDQIGTISYMGLVDDEFKALDLEIKNSLASDQTESKPDNGQQQLTPFGGKIEDLPPLTPENMRQIYEMLQKQGTSAFVQEPTAFSEASMKIPDFTKPKKALDDEKNDEKSTTISNVFSVGEDEDREESITDGTPVLQLQLIEDSLTNAADNTTTLPNLSGANTPRGEAMPSFASEVNPMPILTPMVDEESTGDGGEQANAFNLERL